MDKYTGLVIVGGEILVEAAMLLVLVLYIILTFPLAALGLLAKTTTHNKRKAGA